MTSYITSNLNTKFQVKLELCQKDMMFQEKGICKVGAPFVDAWAETCSWWRSAGLLNCVAQEGCEFLSKIITGDETWVCSYDPELKRHPAHWIDSDEPRPQKAHWKQGLKKVMHIVFFSIWMASVSYWIGQCHRSDCQWWLLQIHPKASQMKNRTRSARRRRDPAQRQCAWTSTSVEQWTNLSRATCGNNVQEAHSTAWTTAQWSVLVSGTYRWLCWSWIDIWINILMIPCIRWFTFLCAYDMNDRETFYSLEGI